MLATLGLRPEAGGEAGGVRYEISAQMSVPAPAEVLAVLTDELVGDLDASDLEDVAVAFDAVDGSLQLETTARAVDLSDAFQLVRARILAGIAACAQRLSSCTDADVRTALGWLSMEPTWSVAPLDKLSLAG